MTWLQGSPDGRPGMAAYEGQLFERLIPLMQDRGWELRRLRLGSLRERPLPDRRYPAGSLAAGGYRRARAIGAVASRTPGLAHRHDLRLPPSSSPEIVTVHGLEPWRFPDEGAVPDWTLRSAEGARRICIVPSAFTHAELRALCPGAEAVVIPHGVAQDLLDPPRPSGELLRELGIAGPYVLHASGASTRKNLPALAEAWRQIAPRNPAQLVLVGAPDPRRDAAFAGVPGVHAVGRRTREEVVQLIASATAVVVPSFYEGFGLPALEAMALGAPVVSSREGALPEVVAEAGLLVAPEARSLAEGLLAVLQSPETQARLRAAGRQRAQLFSWDRAAEAHLEVYEEMLGRSRPRFISRNRATRVQDGRSAEG